MHLKFLLSKIPVTLAATLHFWQLQVTHFILISDKVLSQAQATCKQRVALAQDEQVPTDNRDLKLFHLRLLKGSFFLFTYPDHFQGNST